MKLDQIIGFHLILLAIYLGVNATASSDVDDGLVPGDQSDLYDDDASADGDADPEADTDGSDELAETNGGGKLAETNGHDDADDADGAGKTQDGAKAQDDAGVDEGDTKDTPEKADEDKDTKKTRKQQHDGADTGNEGVVSRSDLCHHVGGGSQFDDLRPHDDEAVRCMEAAGVVTGTASDVYAPRDAVTRADAAVTVSAMIDASNRLERPGVDLAELPEAPQARFADVEPDDPAADAIAQLNEVGIITGYVDARYEPRGRVTRAQMASILDRAYQYMTGEALPAGDDLFDDDDTSVHEDSINAVAKANIIEGVGDRRFEPGHAVRRGPLATYVARTMIRLEETGRIHPIDPSAP